MNSYEQRTLIGRAERTKPKQIKWIMTCVSLNGLSDFNTQYFFMGMVQFESQEYTLQGRMQFFAKLDKKDCFKLVRHDERFCQPTYRRNNRRCAQELIQLTTEISGYEQANFCLGSVHKMLSFQNIARYKGLPS